MPQRILVVDDEKDLVELVCYNLGKEGYEVESATDGLEALRLAAASPPDLVVLDIMLPGMQGLEVLKRLKADASTRDLPVILLTAKSEEFDRVLGLELGADDYVTKPFSPRELVARAKAVLRRAARAKMLSAHAVEAGSKGEVIQAGDVEIDTARHKVLVRGEAVEFSPTEFRLLVFLAANRGRVFSREALLDSVWGRDAFVEPRTVDVHIRRVRAKVEQNPERPVHIKTVRGAGYTFSE